MIQVTVITQVSFNSKEDFDYWFHTERAKGCSFMGEILDSKSRKTPVIVPTYRPKFGCVAVSTVNYSEIKKEESDGKI